MVDTGSSSHIVTDIGKFKEFDETFTPEKHFMELAYVTRTRGVALKSSTAEVYPRDSEGHQVRTMLRGTLDILSV